MQCAPKKTLLLPKNNGLRKHTTRYLDTHTETPFFQALFMHPFLRPNPYLSDTPTTGFYPIAKVSFNQQLTLTPFYFSLYAAIDRFWLF